MIYLRFEEKQQERSRQRLQCYAEKIAKLKKKEEKEAGGNVKVQSFCRGRGRAN